MSDGLFTSFGSGSDAKFLSNLDFVSSTIPTVSAVTVTPATATVNGGSLQQFYAVVVGDGNPAQNVTWTASKGYISPTGLYTAPAATSGDQKITIVATSLYDTNKSGVASVTIPLDSSTPAGTNFIPSVARTVYVQSTLPDFVAGKFWKTTDPMHPTGLKDPNSTIDITFDWSAWLSDVGNANIASVLFTLNGVDNAGTYAAKTSATVFVSGGSITTATVACKITTDSQPPRIDERTIYLTIGDL